MTNDECALGPESRWLSGVALMICAASIAALCAGLIVGVPVFAIYAGYTMVIVDVGVWFCALALAPFMIWAVSHRIERPITEIGVILRGKFGSADSALGIVGPILLMPLLLGAYGTLKQLMPLFAPFKWDATFAEVGRVLMLGYRPWEITYALFGSPFDTQVMNFIYFLWLPILFVVVLGVALVGPAYLRARFFVTFSASWLLLGIVAAFLLSSAGPCYAALIGSSDARAFAPLMARLHAMDTGGYPIGALHWQAELWQANVRHQYGFGMGISAMPSMHNAMCFIYVLCAARSRWWVRAGTWLFAVVILIASVHLGWHYLADGLAGWAGVAGIWWLAGRYLVWCGYAAPVERSEPSGNAEAVPEYFPESLAA